MVSAHCSYKTRLLKITDAAQKPLGDAATSNKRVINQFSRVRASTASCTSSEPWAARTRPSTT